MSRASALAAAADYLHEALTGLDGAARSLRQAGVEEAVVFLGGLHEKAKSLHTDVSHAAAAAHRAERPQFYHESGRWVGRNGKGQN